MSKSVYQITFLNESGEEDFIEVSAYSEAQAVLLSGKDKDIVLVEKTVMHAA